MLSQNRSLAGVKRAHATAFSDDTSHAAHIMGEGAHHSLATLADKVVTTLCTYLYDGLKFLSGLDDQEEASKDERHENENDIQQQSSHEAQALAKSPHTQRNTDQAHRTREVSPETIAKEQQTNPFDIARTISISRAARPTVPLREQYSAMLQARRSILARTSHGISTPATTTASPVHKSLFTERSRFRRSTGMHRTPGDAENILQRMTPHVSRIGKRYTTLPMPPSPQRKAPGTPILHSPAQSSPQTAYRSPGTHLASPVPHPNIFKTKHATRPLVRDEAGSLSDLVARLKQEYPGEYKWKEIDAARKQRDAEIEKLRKPARLPLPKGVKHCVQQIMRGEVPQDEVLIERFNQPIRADDLMTLRPGAWLNDEVINFYMNLINERSKQDSKALKVHCFNTFFYSNFLLPKGYAGVKRFAKRAKVDIASCDMVLVPIHLGVHWCMSAVNRKEKRIEYWDSLRGGSGKVHSKLREYMRNEDPTFAANEAGWRDWIPPSNEAPLQQNGHDCGVFACTTAEYLARGGPVDFDQEDMMDLRVRIAASILDARIY